MGLSDFFKKKGVEKLISEQKPVDKVSQPPIQQAPHQSEYQNQIYIVKEGDSLSKIALNYYGNVKEWSKIFESNKDHIADPNKIKAGQKLTIPN
jgi:nucleoid-associated protein YgaU